MFTSFVARSILRASISSAVTALLVAASTPKISSIQILNPVIASPVALPASLINLTVLIRIGRNSEKATPNSLVAPFNSICKSWNSSQASVAFFVSSTLNALPVLKACSSNSFKPSEPSCSNGRIFAPSPPNISIALASCSVASPASRTSSDNCLNSVMPPNSRILSIT